MKGRKTGYSVLMFLPLLIAGLMFVPPSYSDEQSGSATDLLFMEIPSVVVASKAEESLLTAPGTVYVITDKEIERYGWKNLEDCLKSLPGSDICDFLTYAQYGQRGFPSNGSYTMILIDGREVPTLSSNMIWLNNTILTHNIKRIEVLMGPNSTLYGSKALTGVINIVTKEGYDTKENLDIAETALTYGDENRSQYTANFRKNRKDFSIGGSVSYSQQDGAPYQLQNFVTSTDFIRGQHYNLHDMNSSDFTIVDEDTGINLYMRFKDLYAGVNTRKSINNSGEEYSTYYGFYDNIQNRFDNYNYIGLKHEFSDKLNGYIEYTYALTNNRYALTTSNLNIGQTVTVTTSKNPLVYPPATSYSTLYRQTLGEFNEVDMDRVDGQVNYTPDSKNHIVAGFEWSVRRDLSTNPASGIPGQSTVGPGDQYTADENFWNQSLFAQDTYNLNDKINLVLGADYFQQINSQDRATPKASVIYMPDIKTTWEIVYGEGFRDPLAGEIQRNLNAAAAGYTGAATVLKPMSMTMTELDFKKAFNLCHGVDAFNQASLYTMYQYDTIGTLSVPINGAATIITINSGNHYVNGIEDQIKVNSDKANGYLGFSYIDPEQTTVIAGQPEISNYEVPLWKVKAGAAYKITSMVEAALTADYEDCVQTAALNVGQPGTGTTAIATIPAATIVGLNVKVGDFVADGAKLSFSFLVDNLFNVTYYDANFEATNPYELMQLPRNYRVTMKMTF